MPAGQWPQETFCVHRPGWMLLAIAFPIGLVINLVVGDWDRVAQAVLTLAGAPPEPSLLQRRLARLTTHLGVPTIAIFLLLKSTRLGMWLAPNRLTLGLLLVVDACMLGAAAYLLYMHLSGGMPYLNSQVIAVLTPLVITCLGTGLTALALSTWWHRVESFDKQRAYTLCRRLWKEV